MNLNFFNRFNLNQLSRILLEKPLLNSGRLFFFFPPPHLPNA